jgi:hypothetical protein
MNNNPDNNQSRGRGGRGNRGRGRGSGRGRSNLLSGHAIRRHELNEFVLLMSRLDTRSRRELYNYIGSLLGETPSGPGNPSGNTGEPCPSSTNAPQRSARKPKIFDRAIIKDLPGVAEFAAMNSTEKAQNSGTNRLMSIASGTIARGRRLGLTEEEMRDRIFSTEPTSDILRDLFTEPIPSVEGDENQGDSTSATALGDHSEDLDGPRDMEVSESKDSNASTVEPTATSTLVAMANHMAIQKKTALVPKKKGSWADQCDTSEEETPMKKRTKLSKSERKKRKKDKGNFSLNFDFPTERYDNNNSGPKGPPPDGGGSGSALMLEN